MNTKLLKVNIVNLTKKYKKKKVIDKLNLEINNRKVNFLVSPNGCGKSTLIKAVLKLICYQGTIETNCRSFAYCPEKIVLPDFLRVVDFFNLFDIDINHANSLLQLFKIDNKLRIGQLSKGMHQKIIIIQTLTKEVEGYFFDEPLSGLDSESEKIFIEEIIKLYKKNKLIVIASHYVEKYHNLDARIIRLG